MDDNILEMREITKTFPGVIALDHVNLAVRRGSVHALVGENGAGKSTLMKVLNGVHTADSGEIYVDGKKVTLRNTQDAQAQGIGLIFQECNLVNTLSAAENIYMNRLPVERGKINWKKVNADAQALVDRLGFDFDVTKKVENLSAAQNQLIEIAKVMSLNARLIVMDEPTSSLTTVEVEKLFQMIERLKKEGITIIYISHKLDEIFYLCDTVTVLRDGHTIETRPISDYTRETIIEQMVGRSVETEYPKGPNRSGEVIMKVEHLSRSGLLEDISFELHRGEILGIAGLVGSGRTELAEAIFGAARADKGTIWINGKKVSIRSTHAGKKYGVGLLTEDRKRTGLVLSYDLIKNISITNLDKIKRGPFISYRKERNVTEVYETELNIKTPTMRQLAINLSGGNQQKVVFAKWLFSDVDILILDEPTRGIDVGAKYEIYLLINRLVEQGKSIIMISSELPEVLGMSDRVIVLNEGRKKGELSREDATPEAVMRMAIN